MLPKAAGASLHRPLSSLIAIVSDRRLHKRNQLHCRVTVLLLICACQPAVHACMSHDEIQKHRYGV